MAVRHVTDTRLVHNIIMGVKEMEHQRGLDLPGSGQCHVNITMKRQLLQHLPNVLPRIRHHSPQ
jgi:hypothetical protein